jgi:hypothetical protein
MVTHSVFQIRGWSPFPTWDLSVAPKGLFALTWSFAGSRLLKPLAACAAICAGILIVYFRFLRSRISIELSGSLLPIRLPRRGTVGKASFISPKEGLPAFELRLPKPLTQLLFYRGGSLVVDSNTSAKVRFEVSRNAHSSQIQLPIVKERLVAFWEQIPATPTQLTIRFRQGRQCGQAIISYPRGIP